MGLTVLWKFQNAATSGPLLTKTLGFRSKLVEPKPRTLERNLNEQNIKKLLDLRHSSEVEQIYSTSATENRIYRNNSSKIGGKWPPH